MIFLSVYVLCAWFFFLHSTLKCICKMESFCGVDHMDRHETTKQSQLRTLSRARSKHAREKRVLFFLVSVLTPAVTVDIAGLVKETTTQRMTRVGIFAASNKVRCATILRTWVRLKCFIFVCVCVLVLCTAHL
jgi:hypothetical protein